MNELPKDIVDLLRERDAAREAKDFARADQLRGRVEAAGYIVRDTTSGSVADQKPAFVRVDPASIADVLGTPPTCAITFHLLTEGFPGDLARFLKGFAAHNRSADAEVVVVDNASGDAEQVHEITSGYDFARALHLDRALGWAAARNVGMKTSLGAVVVLVDLSIEPIGDICAPLEAAFTDPTVGLAGPYGLVSDDMREWRAAAGSQADAIEGYFLAVRRDLLAHGLIREKFHWYRNADIDFSFQIRTLGTSATVVDVPVRKHVHRGWEALGPDERAKRSRRNHRIFFEQWKGQLDLLTGAD